MIHLAEKGLNGILADGKSHLTCTSALPGAVLLTFFYPTGKRDGIRQDATKYIHTCVSL